MVASSLVLTIDIDWAHDAVIADLAEIVASHGVAATWFVTHPTPVLRDIAATPRQELGIHPNFNPLLEGAGKGDPAGIISRLREIVPDPSSVRSHSLTRSSRLASLFHAHGLTHESNYLLPPSLGEALRPWRDFFGLVQVPIRWEDDVRLLDASLGEPVEHHGRLSPLVVDFHPIHVFLNTTSIVEYKAARPDSQKPAALLARRRPAGSGGSRDRLLALLARASEVADRGLRVADLDAEGGVRT